MYYYNTCKHLVVLFKGIKPLDKTAQLKIKISQPKHSFLLSMHTSSIGHMLNCVNRARSLTGQHVGINSCGKCSKILDTSCLLRQHRQTAQTQIRLKKGSLIRVFTVCNSGIHFAYSSPVKILFENRERGKCLKF